MCFDQGVPPEKRQCMQRQRQNLSSKVDCQTIFDTLPRARLRSHCGSGSAPNITALACQATPFQQGWFKRPFRVMALNVIKIQSLAAPGTPRPCLQGGRVALPAGVTLARGLKNSPGLQAKFTGRVTLLPETILRLLRLVNLASKAQTGKKTGK